MQSAILGSLDHEIFIRHAFQSVAQTHNGVIVKQSMHTFDQLIDVTKICIDLLIP